MRVYLHYLTFLFKGTVMGTPNREPQEHSRNIMGIHLPGSLCSIMFLLYSWGSLFEVPIKVPLLFASTWPETLHPKARNSKP